MGSFSTTVPEKAWGEKKVLCHGTVEKYKSRNWCEGQSQRTGSDLEAARCAWKCCGAVVLRVAVAGVAVRRVVVAHTAADQPPLVKVGGAALAGVAAHTVLPAARLQDGLPRDGLPVLHVHKQPEKKKKRINQLTSTVE